MPRTPTRRAYLRRLRARFAAIDPEWAAELRRQYDREDPGWSAVEYVVLAGRPPLAVTILCRGGFLGERIDGFRDDDPPPPALALAA